MEKRIAIVLAVLLALIVIPSITADISLQGPGKTVVNIGDQLTLSGYLLRNQDTVGTFKLILSCQGEQQLLVRTLSLQANIQKPFAETVTIPTYVDSPCVIKAIFESQGALLEQASSPSFTISRDLAGTFQIDPQQLKLGDDAKITATITKLDGSPFNGIATIRFKQGTTDLFLDTASIQNSHFTYTFATQDNPSGQYQVEVTAQDVYGNTQTFQAGSFAIAGDLLVFAEPDKLHYSPGEKIKISGEVTILDQPVKRAKINLQLGENKEEDTFSYGTFTQTIHVPAAIHSGTQIISIKVEDEFGNRGFSDLSIIIDPKPTKITLTKDQETYLPGQVVKLTPALLDQADAVINTDIGIIIKNPKGKDIFSDTIISNAEYEVKLAETALPGAWTIHLFALGIKEEATFLVGEQIVLDYTLSNTSLFITNRGNIKFIGPIKIEYKSLDQKFTLLKEFTISPGETITVDLTQGVEPGVYDIMIGDRVFEKINISKNSLSTEDKLTILLGLIAVVLIILLMLYIRGWKRHKHKGHGYPHKPSHPPPVRYHPKTEEETVRGWRQRFADQMESKKPKLSWKIKRKGHDEYIYELPKKKERGEQSRPYPSWDLERTKEPEGWREPDYTSHWHQEPTSSYQEKAEPKQEPKREKKSDDEQKGLFNMFD